LVNSGTIRSGVGVESVVKARNGLLSKNIISDAKNISQGSNRSLAGQIEYWAALGKMVEENPDLVDGFIKKVLMSQRKTEE